ncbi:hypothetical protein [Nocardia sp. NPDC006630]|uniref:hypothetical protein n=1 Tax=Nocardia sp. NPDC006630 TaxID=3157181 RepID=UPI0033AF8FE1
MPTSKKRKKRTTSKSAQAHRAPAADGVGFHDDDLIHVAAGRPPHLSLVVPGDEAGEVKPRLYEEWPCASVNSEGMTSRRGVGGVGNGRQDDGGFIQFMT